MSQVDSSNLDKALFKSEFPLLNYKRQLHIFHTFDKITLKVTSFVKLRTITCAVRQTWQAVEMDFVLGGTSAACAGKKVVDKVC